MGFTDFVFVSVHLCTYVVLRHFRYEEGADEGDEVVLAHEAAPLGVRVRLRAREIEHRQVVQRAHQLHQQHLVTTVR